MTAAKRTIATIATLSLFIGACGGDQEDQTSGTTANTSSTTTTIEATTTTAATTTTTLSEQDEAEAEVEQLVIDWWTAPADGSKGEEQEHLQYLTGLLLKRSNDYDTQLANEGQILFSDGDRPIEVTEVQIDLDAGSGEIDACTGDNASLVDAETGETIGTPSDPTNTWTSEFQVERTDDGWKISEWYASFNTGDPIECTIELQ